MEVIDAHGDYIEMCFYTVHCVYIYTENTGTGICYLLHLNVYVYVVEL